MLIAMRMIRDISYLKFPAKSGFHRIDGRWVYTDSLMEARIIRRLVKAGFSGKWRRYGFGISASIFRYTPDVHLSIMHDGMIRRALVEFKPVSEMQFNKKSRLRMIAAAKFFKDALCFLYIEDTRQWYIVEVDGSLVKTGQPVPGGVAVSKLPRPRFMLPIYSKSGRVYWERPGMYLVRQTVDGVGYIVSELLRGGKKR